MGGKGFGDLVWFALLLLLLLFHAWCLWKPAESIESPRTGVMAVEQLGVPNGLGELNLGPLKEQLALNH